MQSQLNKKIDEITLFIKSKIKRNPEIGMILGSGLGDFVELLEDKVVIPYGDIPHVPQSTAPGHAGNLVCGKLNGKELMVMQGRFHVYEGHDPKDATLLIRAMKKLGVNKLIITCACGGLNHHMEAGDIMIIMDHINFSGTNPLVGENLNEFGPRFPVMFDIYTKELREAAHTAAMETKIQVHIGVYAGILGPTYATRSELAFYIDSHCDAIGMSLVQESIVAAHSGMQILALAAITDMALPYAHQHATGEEVIASGKKIGKNLKQLITKTLELI